MKRLVVGVDHASWPSPALDWSANVAKGVDAEVIAVSAWMPAQSELPPEESVRELHEVSDALHANIASRARQSGPAYRDEVIPGAPVDVILQRGDTEDADLLVVGMRGRGGAPVHVRGVAETLAHRATRPLAIVPEASTQTPRRIVLGLDGSEGACAAASWCAVFASATGADVIAVAVYTQQIELIPEDDPSSVYAYFQRKLHSDWTAPLRAADVHVEPRLMRDIRASDSLRRAANEADADAIVVGNHRVGRLVHLRAGGNALRLLHATNVPLVLVPPT